MWRAFSASSGIGIRPESTCSRTHPLTNPAQDIITQLQRENEAMEKQTKELHNLIKLMEDGHSLACERRTRLLAENMILQLLCANLQQGASGHLRGPDANVARSAAAPGPNGQGDLQALYAVIRGVTGGPRQQPDAPGAPPGPAAFLSVPPLAPDTILRERAAVPWMRPPLTAARLGPDDWEECD
mmetsp:Transcript_143472/g.399962  ORF Transcript_143472/g.399962 Transcript_143472/m.399962 type:complete len:185 (+) Transcript_143472:84-638(+)